VSRSCSSHVLSAVGNGWGRAPARFVAGALVVAAAFVLMLVTSAAAARPGGDPQAARGVLSASPANAAAVLVRLGPGKFGHPLWLDVVTGNYKLTSGTTLLPGSSVGVSEDDLTFPPGLAVDVQGGTITLQGKSYPAGTKLLVNAQGKLVPRGATAPAPGTKTPPKTGASPRLPLTVVVHGPGRVTSRPLGISCPGICRASFVKGTAVTMLDHQASNGVFDHWALGCKGVGSCTFRMTVARTVVAFFKSGAPFTPPPATTPTTTTTPAPPPPPAATSGHYSGRTSQNEIIAFDVSADSTMVTGLQTGQINQSCTPPDYNLSAGNLSNWQATLARDGSFAISWNGASSVGGEPATERIAISGRISSGTASGALRVDTVWTHGSTTYNCSSGDQTWTATKTG